MTVQEDPLFGQVELHTSSDGTTWIPWFGDANNVTITRGGRADGASVSVDVGTLTVTLVNAGDPMTDSTLQPNQLIRLRTAPVGDSGDPLYIAPVPIFTGRIFDLTTTDQLDKSTNELTVFTAISAVDAVSVHQNVTRYGAVTAGGAGYETWAARIIRLSASATEPVATPADDSPIVRYAI